MEIILLRIQQEIQLVRFSFRSLVQGFGSDQVCIMNINWKLHYILIYRFLGDSIDEMRSLSQRAQRRHRQGRSWGQNRGKIFNLSKKIWNFIHVKKIRLNALFIKKKIQHINIYLFKKYKKKVKKKWSKF